MKNNLKKLRLLCVGVIVAGITFLTGCSKSEIVKPTSVAATSNNELKAGPVNPIANANAAYNGWLNAFLIRSGSQTYFCNSTTDRSRAFFWGQAYMITTVEDACDRNPTAERRQLVTDLLNTLLINETTDWTWDTWNDDVEWAVIACIRGYRITGNTAYLNAAANNWNMVYHRGWDSTFGGGIWELMDDKNSGGGKGGLSNWPFIIAGCMLYEATNDGWYRDRCVDDYNWARVNCFDPNSGRVYEGTGPNGMNGDDNSYNSGLLVNACASLYKITGNSQCYNDAVKAADHYIGRIGGLGTGIMSEDHPANGDFGSDQVSRGLAKLASQNNLWSKYGPFLANNCVASWNHRRTDYNITWNNFSSNTTTGLLRAMEAQSSVTVQMVTPEGGQPVSFGNGTYKLINRQTGKALDVVGASTANNTAIDVWPYSGANNQRWTLTSIGSGLFKLIGVGSGKSINIGSSSLDNNAPVILYDYQNTANENIYLTSPESGYYIIHFSHSGKVLDVNTSNNSVIQWDENGGQNQQWQIQTP